MTKKQLEEALVSYKKKRTILLIIAGVLAAIGLVLFILGLNFAMDNYSKWGDIKPENLILLMVGSIIMDGGLVLLVVSLAVFSSKISNTTRLLRDDTIPDGNENQVFSFSKGLQTSSDDNEIIDVPSKDQYPKILAQYEELMKQGIITKEEFEQKKKEYLG